MSAICRLFCLLRDISPLFSAFFAFNRTFRHLFLMRVDTVIISCKRSLPRGEAFEYLCFKGGNVPKAEWGQKRICPSCGKLYYDMKKNPPVCPACKTPFDTENLLRSRRGRGADKKAASKDIADEMIDDIPVAAAADDAVIEDAEELADESVDDVVEVEEEET